MNWLDDNLPWIARAEERWRPRSAEPLRVRAWLRSPIAWDPSAPPQLEGALQHVVVRRETGRMPDDVFAGCPREEAPDVPVPIVDERIGGLSIACASSGWPWPLSREGTRYRNKRARLDALGGTGRATIAGGMFKSLHIPVGVLVTPILDFFVRGDRAPIEELLRDVAGIGRDQTRGPGGVERWEVTPDPLDRSLVFRGRPMRPLPRVEGGRFDHRAFVPGSFEHAFRTTRAPYWRTWLASPCVVPVIPVGDPTSWWAEALREEEAGEHENRAPGAFVAWEVTLLAVEHFRHRVERMPPERARTKLLWHLRHARPDGGGVWVGPSPMSLRFRAEPRGDGLLVTDVAPAGAQHIKGSPDTTPAPRSSGNTGGGGGGADIDFFAEVDALPRAPAEATSARTGARGRFFITPHAIQRYRERIHPGIDDARALEELVDLTSRGRLVRITAAEGPVALAEDGTPLPESARVELWRGPRVGTHGARLAQSRFRFVVAHGSGGELPQVITVLPVGEQRGKDERR